MLKKFDQDSLALFETHAEGERAGRICQRLGFENQFRVDASGQSGGIWLLLRSSMGEVEIVVPSNQFIHARIVIGDESMNLVVVYAAPSVSRISGLWEELREVVRGAKGPLIIGVIIILYCGWTRGHGVMASCRRTRWLLVHGLMISP